MANAKRDDNYIPTLTAVSNADGSTPVTLYADPTTHRLLVSSTVGTLDDVGDVVITSGAQGDVLYNNGTNWVNLAAGTSGQFLKTNGAGANPAWATATLAPAGADTQVQFNNAGSIGASANLTWVSPALTIGVAGSATGQLKITGATSGTAILTVAATAGTPTLTLPTTTDTLVGKATTDTLTNKTLVAPALGAATATSINGLTITTSTGVLTITNGKTFSVSNTLTLAGTDSTTMTFPGTSATIARTDAGQTFTGVNTFTSPKIITDISDTNGNELIKFTATGSAVNEVTIVNAATGTAGPIIKSGGESNVDLQLAAIGTGAVHVTTGSYGDITADTDGATVTFNLATSNVHGVTLGGNRTLAISNAHVGQIFTIRLLQDGTGSRTVTWFTTIKWAGGSAPTLTTTASKADTFVFLVTSAGNYDGYIVGANV